MILLAANKIFLGSAAGQVADRDSAGGVEGPELLALLRAEHAAGAGQDGVVRKKKRLAYAVFYVNKKPNICQDRLGTDTGKVAKRTFLQAS